MSTLSNARTAARALLKKVTGEERPMWRQCFTEMGLVHPDAIAQVCLDDGHDSEDPTAYPCCPDPVIEVEQPELGAYLVELLNADAEDGLDAYRDEVLAEVQVPEASEAGRVLYALTLAVAHLLHDVDTSPDGEALLRLDQFRKGLSDTTHGGFVLAAARNLMIAEGEAG